MERTTVPFLQKILMEWGKMAFVTGPRQVGKTTLARQFGQTFGPRVYFSWDDVNDQKKFMADPYFFEKIDKAPDKPLLVILDEIHKYSRWKNYLKGAYDKYQEDHRFLVTGSGRLDLFIKGGDSLMGRYITLPLFPLTVGEIGSLNPRWKEFKESLQDMETSDPSSREAFESLLALSGFPDPYLKGNSEYYTVWFQERKKRLIREDIRDATRIREISQMEILAHLLPERVGAPLSTNSLREDLGVAFETVRDWLMLLSSFYYLFKLTPYYRSIKKSLLREPKLYLYDWVEVPEEGHRFENLMALHLQKAVATWNARGEGILGLHYLRDKDKREVDFVITEKQKPILLIEAKNRDTEPHPALGYFQDQLNIPVTVQVVSQKGILRKLKVGKGIQWIVSAEVFLKKLP